MYRVKEGGLSKHAIFWGLLFIEFWIFMDVLVFGKNIPNLLPVIRSYAGSVYATLIPLTLASLSISFYFITLYGLASFRYVTKFGKYTSLRILAEDIIAVIVTSVLYGTLVLISVIALFQLYKGVPVIPSNVPGLYLNIVLMGIEVYLLGYVLSLLVAKVGAVRSAKYIPFAILMLAFLTFIPASTDFGNLIYVLPILNCAGLIFWSFIGKIPPRGGWWYSTMFSGSYPQLNIGLCYVSTIVWIVVLFLISLRLLKTTNPIPVEELVR